MSQFIRHYTLPALCLVAAIALVVAASKSDPVSQAEHEREEVELAPFMAQLQLHSQKLGFSIEG